MVDKPEYVSERLDREFWRSTFSSYAVLAWVLVLSQRLLPEGLEYSTFVFFSGPLLAGLVAGVVGNWKEKRSGSRAFTVSLSVFGLAFLTMMVWALEGLICLVMAAPILIASHAIGYAIGRYFRTSGWKKGQPLLVSLVPVFAVFAVVTAFNVPPDIVRSQTTMIVVDATPEEVWPHLFNIDELPPTRNVLFQSGIAHPVQVRSEGQFLGAWRECVLTTGVMPERISILEPYKRMRFDVLHTPPSMREVNPFGEVHAAHLEGYNKVHYGEFRLESSGDGRTRLYGTSVYSHRFYPEFYWSLWTDAIAHFTHLRVMNEIKHRAERD